MVCESCHFMSYVRVMDRADVNVSTCKFSCEGCGAFIACVTAMIGSCYSRFTISCPDYRLHTAITHVIN